MKLGERLVAKGLINNDDVQRALDVQHQAGGRIGSILIRMGAVSEDIILSTLSEQLGYPCLSPKDMPAALDIYQ